MQLSFARGVKYVSWYLKLHFEDYVDLHLLVWTLLCMWGSFLLGIHNLGRPSALTLYKELREYLKVIWFVSAMYSDTPDVRSDSYRSTGGSRIHIQHGVPIVLPQEHPDPKVTWIPRKAQSYDGPQFGKACKYCKHLKARINLTITAPNATDIGVGQVMLCIRWCIAIL